MLLTTGGGLAPERWREAVDRAGARRQVARFLVDSGGLAGGELEICHLAAIFDAAFFALSPGSGPSRFRRGATHWIGSVRSVPAAAVERETRRRRELLDAVWPYPLLDTAPVVPRPAAPGQTVTPGSGSCCARRTACAPRPTSRGYWAGPPSTRCSTYGASRRPDSSRPRTPRPLRRPRNPCPTG